MVVQRSAVTDRARRLDPAWIVFRSIENDHHDRCVDLFRRPDGSFGFEEFRRDVEDRGHWTPVAWFSGLSHPTEESALAAARRAVPWLAEAAR
ncbi:hypothetical protein [Enterovirga rhinocerotis]|uniref:Uncharacterized protein n=1 Tax=Enterovirga rhinocerotis TaxID=1339210 RepID=A0A4R7BV28_9HYPH|nr:hypothetical protein [Enterovirga rhinocerotis]TDR89670.1 hypothetical protein EV668_2505 [Enterovirga rhinocerotis]